MGEDFKTRYSKALIRLGNTCNNQCRFCHARGAGTRKFDIDTVEAMRRIQDAGSRRVGMAVFSGGEPTMRKDLVALCRHAKSLGLASGIITNGRMLCYKNFTEELLSVGLEYVVVSLHGPDAETHNHITTTDSFSQTLAGIKNISGKSAQLVVNTVLTHGNITLLDHMTALLKKFAPLHYKISIPEPRGAVLANPELFLTPFQAEQAVERFLRNFDPERLGITVGFDGFTPCSLKGFVGRNDDFFTHGFKYICEADSTEFHSPDHGDRTFAPVCIDCSMYHLCPGIYKVYEKMGGQVVPFRELSPDSI
jgi:MoaA/NifB/PqqE/SkfB family radical SAM enzyme